MTLRINLKTAREEIDQKYVHFRPNTDAVKPVHIAGGLLRTIYGQYNRTEEIKRMAIVSSKKGITPKGNDIDTVYDKLKKEKKIDDIPKDKIEALRNAMQCLLSADNGVFAGATLSETKMTSYSAGSKYFLTPRSILEDAGEFIGFLIEEFCPRLAEHVRGLLAHSDDPISNLFCPIMEEDMVLAVKNKIKNSISNEFANSIKTSGECLLGNIKKNKNALSQLRIFNLFCIFNLIRYMTLLETFYCGEHIKPILLDFSGKRPNDSSIARTSQWSYSQINKSLNRFYAWGYAEWLKEKYNNDLTELLNSETPVYGDTKRTNRNKSKLSEEFQILWKLAQDKYKNSDTKNSNEIFKFFGETMYNMLALDASAYPVSYLRALGTKSGILYPPDDGHPKKRFKVSQDIVEMIVKSCVDSNETITSACMIERLWDRFGIIVGGNHFSINNLKKNNMILQTDEKSLAENFDSFAKILQSMDFAEIMADGILQIKI